MNSNSLHLQIHTKTDYVLQNSVFVAVCFQSFLLGLSLSSLIISPVPLLVRQPGKLGREATERMLETVTANWERRLWSGQLCDSTLPYLLWFPWHTAALLSQSMERLQDPLPQLLCGPLLVWQAEARLDFSHGTCAKKYLQNKTSNKHSQLKCTHGNVGAREK